MSVRERFWRREGERVEMFALISGPETSNKQVLFPGQRYEEERSVPGAVYYRVQDTVETGGWGQDQGPGQD